MLSAISTCRSLRPSNFPTRLSTLVLGLRPGTCQPPVKCVGECNLVVLVLLWSQYLTYSKLSQAPLVAVYYAHHFVATIAYLLSFG
jgi:hypothetical protein